jgi:hypothetical protein
MGIASRRKKERKLQDNVTITESDNSFLDYLVNIDLSSDLVPITDDLIQELIEKRNMPKDEILAMQKLGYKYSVSRGSFLMFDN